MKESLAARKTALRSVAETPEDHSIRWETTGESGSLVQVVILLVLAAGALLRIYQSYADVALSLDEIALAHNILERNLWTLVSTPLAFDQTAPKGFLLASKLATSVFGSTDFALRLFPLICSLAGLVAFWRLAARILDGIGLVVAVLLFSLAIPVIEYAGVVKQYAGDIAVAALLSWMALSLAPGAITRRRALWGGAAGAVAVWFSQPAVFVLVGLGVVLLAAHWREGGARSCRVLAPTILMWGIAAGAAVWVGFASMTPATHDYMRRYWAPGFMPWPPYRAIRTFWPWKPLIQTIEDLGYPAPSLYILLMAAGFAYLIWRRRIAASLLLAPMAVALGAAIIRQYPFSDRLILFLLPVFLLGIAAGIEALWRFTGRASRGLSAAAVLIATGPALYATAENPPLYQMENIKPVLERLQEKRIAGDAVYVYYGAVPAVRFYAADFDLNETDYVAGACHRGYNRNYLEELDTFRGSKRFWLVMTHAFPPYREREDILGYLDTIGARRDTFRVTAQTSGGEGLPAEVFLYDLSDPRRLRQAAAQSFPTSGPNGPHPRFTCDEGPQMMMPRASGLAASRR